MAKKKWYVREEQPTVRIWEYVVEAETAEEAEDLVLNGEVEAYDYYDGGDAETIEIVEVRQVNTED